MVALPEFIEQVISTYHKAAEFNQLASGREGNVVVVTPELADEVMITGDIHGHRRNYNLICRIAALERHPRRHLVMQEVCHGGPVYAANGGCMSHTLLEDVAALKVEYPEQVHFLLGNHELSELIDYPIQKNRQMLNLLFRLGVKHVYGEAADRVRGAYVEFIRTCPLAVRMPTGVFVSHSVPDHCDTRGYDTSVFTRPLETADYREHGPVFDLVWGRDYRQANAEAFARTVGAKVLIHGHEPCREGFAAPNRLQIILDCCCDTACYVVLRPDQPLTHAEIVKRIRPLG
jgi:hypothetical protein